MSERAELRRLYEERNAAIEHMRAVVDKADQEKRSITGEEQGEITSREGDIERLDGEIRTREKVLKLSDSRTNIEPPNSSGSEWVEEPEEKREAPKTLNEYRKSIAAQRPQDLPEYRAAFFRLMSVRDTREMTGDEARALSKATASAGANLVPTDFARQLIDTLRDFGSMRQIANVQTTDNGDTLQVPTVSSHGTASWTAENAAFSASDDAFGQASLSAYKAATIIQVSEELLQDSAFDLEAYIRNEFGLRIGVLENTAYVVGDGSAKPTGITTQASSSGVTLAAGNTTTITSDSIFDLVYSVLPAYRRNGSFLMHDSSVKAVRKLKDTTGQYLWGAGINATNQQDSLLGYPLYSDPDMPVMAANAKSVLFGNFQYYWIRDVDGVAIQRLNELYAANGQVGFRAYHRTDGKLLNTAAVKYLANSAT